jgi:hypothetical protein
LQAERLVGKTLELELILGARPEFAGIARYTQFIARRSSGSAKKEYIR